MDSCKNCETHVRLYEDVNSRLNMLMKDKRLDFDRRLDELTKDYEQESRALWEEKAVLKEKVEKLKIAIEEKDVELARYNQSIVYYKDIDKHYQELKESIKARLDNIKKYVDIDDGRPERCDYK